MRRIPVAVLSLAVAALSSFTGLVAQDRSQPVTVYILAGQSTPRPLPRDREVLEQRQQRDRSRVRLSLHLRVDERPICATGPTSIWWFANRRAIGCGSGGSDAEPEPGRKRNRACVTAADLSRMDSLRADQDTAESRLSRFEWIIAMLSVSVRARDGAAAAKSRSQRRASCATIRAASGSRPRGTSASGSRR
jgi:hypothetical protein